MSIDVLSPFQRPPTMIAVAVLPEIIRFRGEFPRALSGESA